MSRAYRWSVNLNTGLGSVGFTFVVPLFLPEHQDDGEEERSKHPSCTSRHGVAAFLTRGEGRRPPLPVGLGTHAPLQELRGGCCWELLVGAARGDVQHHNDALAGRAGGAAPPGMRRRPFRRLPAFSGVARLSAIHLVRIEPRNSSLHRVGDTRCTGGRHRRRLTHPACRMIGGRHAKTLVPPRIRTLGAQAPKTIFCKNPFWSKMPFFVPKMTNTHPPK
jgi:hypothetical protein